MTQFSDLNLDPKVLKAVTEAGYVTPTPIQAGAIPHALEGKDVLGIAQTGTGKTASFVLPMITLLQKGRARARMPRSLVLCPTRELAAQVAENFDTYAKHTKLSKALLIGGVSFKEQDLLIDRGVDVLIATPGRLLDHFERGKLLLTGVQIMVVDEADRMLDMGFIPDIERIFGLTPFTRQTMFYSATMAPEIERITSTFLSNPARIEVARQATASETIEQGVVMFKGSRKDREPGEKRALLRAIIEGEGERLTNAIIFCNRKSEVDVVAKSLKKSGYNAEPIHGDLEQSQRTRTLDAFRDGSLRLLVASDVAARGLDIPAVSHVINFDVPSHAEDYIHRIGRTGRAGRSGKAMMICQPRDEKYFAAVEALIQREIPRLELPAGSSLGGDDAPEPARGDSADAAARRPADEETRAPRSRGRRGSQAGDRAGDNSGDRPEPKPRGVRRDTPGSRTEAPRATPDVPVRHEGSRPEPVAEAAHEAAPAEAARSRSLRPQSSRPEPSHRDQPRPDQSRAEPSQADPPRPDRSRSEPRPEQSRGEQPRAEQPHSEQSRPEQSRAGQSPDRQRRDRGGRGRRSEPQGEAVVGMGDDVPSFIAQSFAERSSS